MLESIYIENFAIIDQLQIDFHDQMTVLTGETGAGKSIIIDAIGQLCGNRSQTSFIKSDANESFIEGVFSIKDNSSILDKLREYRIEYDDKLIVSKSFNRNNKTTIKINYRNVSTMALKSIMKELIDIHSQFETHTLFDSNNHINILDDYIGKPLVSLKQKYKEVYQKYIDIKKTYQKAVEEELSDEQLEYYQSQLSEINSLNLTEIDEEKLEAEKKRLLDFEKTNEKINNYRQYMEGNQGILSLLSSALNELEALNQQANYQQIYEQMYDLYYNLIDLNDAILDEYNRNDFDEFRLNEIQETLFKLNRLKRKYGQSINAILNAKKEIEDKILSFTNRETHINDLKSKLDSILIQVNQSAKEITTLRKQKALEFTNKVMEQLKSLYLEKVVFEIDFQKSSLQKNGQDIITFLVSTNSGQTLQPLNKIASGGEMSRIMLAIKTLSLSSGSLETIIFDEADSGVSGKVAESIGAKMKYIAKKYQVLCISHLAQVASFANHHYLIEKTSNDDNTSVKVSELSEEKSILEIAKLISGKDISKESIDHAKKLKLSNE
ncbi:DNA repair protein RecN [Thomasclavelia spiroformis]|uniref:DNA repair protein RecN n=1 Tax=Thomasclavelia spiroformis TaxID=29348 RepID=UPI000B38E192|nr:DNA repair protein RecN [Thomasclavelia spiroformis]OUO71775.1 DNA repair protein RecN [Thomasclavelia spiroformis]